MPIRIPWKTERLEALSGAKGWIVFGGTPMASRAALNALPGQLRRRAIIAPALPISATDPEMTTAAAEGEKSLREAEHSVHLAEILDRATPGGRAVLHLQDTIRALDEGAAHFVFVTGRFFEGDGDDAEDLARRALTHGAQLVEVSGAAAVLLDESGDGVGAVLRFAPHAAVNAG